MLRHRIIFGLLFSALFVAIVFADTVFSAAWRESGRGTPPGLLVAIAATLVIPLALYEMQALLAKGGVVISLRVVTGAALLCMLWPWIEQVAGQREALHIAAGRWENAFRTVKPHYLVPTVLAAALLAALVMHSRQQKVHGAMASAGGTLLAIVYLGVLPGFFLPICLSHTAWMMLATLGIVKSADIGAYTVGRLLGRHKLIPWLSPGKTIEGFLGGLVFSGIVGMIAAACFRNFTWPQGLIAGVILGAIGQVGDLLESLLKRDAGVKDSGAVPGFGGILDILDSPLLAAPAAYWLLKLLVR